MIKDDFDRIRRFWKGAKFSDFVRRTLRIARYKLIKRDSVNKK